MKDCYSNLNHGATIHLMKMDMLGSWVITAIEVQHQHRGRGYATEVLQQVLDDADGENVVLQLHVSGDGSPKALTDDELYAWYRRHGFIDVGEYPGCNMRRMPSESRE